jgi:hypothetical protein
MAEVVAARLKARLATVEEHVRCENRHDLAALMATFGAYARYDDEPWQDHRLGLEGARSYYTELLASLPDLAIEIRQRHVASDAIVLEVTIRAHIWESGEEECPQPVDAWNFLSAVSSPSMPKTGSPASGSTTTAGP